MLALSVVDREGVRALVGINENFKIGICWFFTKPVALRSKSKD
jgi:hypothetical protein